MKAAKGNYTAYFQRRGGSEDAERRLNLLPADKLANKVILDIGCSSGEFTMIIAKKFEPRSILGIDIDDKLIGTANAQLQTEKSSYLLRNSDYNTSNKKKLIPRIIQKPTVACTSKKCERSLYPQNVTFICTTILDNNIRSNSYDTICCLSVVKWIHLDQGDNGLIDFFYRVHDLLKDDGFLILEYQPWASYDRAVKERKQEKIYQNYCQLALRPEHFESILEDKIGFNIISRQGPAVSEAKGYHRPILIAQKQPIIASRNGVDSVKVDEVVKKEEKGEKGGDKVVKKEENGEKGEKGEKGGDKVMKRKEKGGAPSHNTVAEKRVRGEDDALSGRRPKRTNSSTYAQRNAVFGSSFPTRNQGVAAGSWSM